MQVENELKPFWITSSFPCPLLGFGVTAWNLADALNIITAVGYGQYLPDQLSTLQVTEDVKTSGLERLHIVPNMGPIVVRGMWYPFVVLGVPRWTEERIRNQ